MKNLVKVAALSICSIVLVACGDNFLTRDPFGSTITQEQYAAMSNQLEGSLRGIYSMLARYKLDSEAHDEFGRRSLDLYCDLMSGDMALTDHKYGWFYSDEMGQGNTGRTGFIWTYYYGMLRNVNSVILIAKGGDAASADNVIKRIAASGLPNKYDSKKGEYYTISGTDTVATFTESEAKVAYYYAQALSLRGYIYSNLLMLYCETPRHIDDFKRERCFPMYNELNMEMAQGLATMAEVYTQLESDLTEAIDYFEAFNKIERSSKIEVDASIAEAFLAYSYLNKGNPKQNPSFDDYKTAYTNARDYALKAIASSSCKVLSISDLTETGFNNVSNTSWMWGEDVTIETTGGLASWFGQCDIHSYSYAWSGDTKAIDENLYKLIADSTSTAGKPNGHPFDARVNWFNDGSGNSVYKYCGDGKFYSAQCPTSTKADDIDREWLSDNVFMRIEMMYLIAAEASYRLGNDDDAITYLRAITDERVLTGKETEYDNYIAGLNHNNLLAEIEYNWRVELWGEGYSLMTFRRLSAETPERRRGANHGANGGSKMEAGSSHIFVMPSAEGSYNPSVNQAPRRSPKQLKQH